MKKRLLTVLIMVISIMFVLGGCKNSSEKNQTLEQTDAIHKITAEQAKKIMDENTDIIVLDVRTKEEYNEGHIEGAILIPNEDINDTQPEQLPELNKQILLYCRTGNRSGQASEKLSKIGYTNIYDFGGIQDWPYDIVKE